MAQRPPLGRDRQEVWVHRTPPESPSAAGGACLGRDGKGPVVFCGQGLFHRPASPPRACPALRRAGHPSNRERRAETIGGNERDVADRDREVGGPGPRPARPPGIQSAGRSTGGRDRRPGPSRVRAALWARPGGREGASGRLRSGDRVGRCHIRAPAPSTQDCPGRAFPPGTGRAPGACPPAQSCSPPRQGPRALSPYRGRMAPNPTPNTCSALTSYTVTDGVSSPLRESAEKDLLASVLGYLRRRGLCPRRHRYPFFSIHRRLSTLSRDSRADPLEVKATGVAD